MKVYIDKNEMKLLKVDKERPFYTGYESDHLPSIITVYFNTDVSESSVTLSFLLANGRTPRKNLVFDANGTEIVNGTTWYYYTWNLSTKEGILTSPGQLQMTLSVTTSGVVKQLLFTNNVVRTARFGNNENVVVYSNDPLETILDFAYDSEGITTALAAANVKLDNLDHKINYIGENFETKQDMYDAAFSAIYTNNNSLVTARFEDNVYVFLRSDSEDEEYLMMVDASTYGLYKIDTEYNEIEISGGYTKAEVDNLISLESQARANADTALDSKIATEKSARIQDVETLTSAVNKLNAVQNVVDIVGTYADLLNYNTTRLEYNDAIQVMSDENIIDRPSTAYRWVSTNGGSWEYIGMYGGNSYSKTQINEMFDDEESDRASDVSRLEGLINAEASARNNAVGLVNEALQAEITNRTNADTTLQNNIDAVANDLQDEETARINAVNDLQDSIDDEAEARANAIANEVSARNTAISNAIATEDSNIKALIQATKELLQAEDTNLSNRITAEANFRSEADANLNTAISNEITARRNVTDNLSARITQLASIQNVVDTVGTYADLIALDVKDEDDNWIYENDDKIQVIADETRSGATTIYSFEHNSDYPSGHWKYIGSYGGNAYTKVQVNELLEGYVAKETGKDLSDNNYSDAEKEKNQLNANSRHWHTNKDILDAITAAFTTELYNKLASLEVAVETVYNNTTAPAQGKLVYELRQNLNNLSISVVTLSNNYSDLSSNKQNITFMLYPNGITIDGSTYTNLEQAINALNDYIDTINASYITKSVNDLTNYYTKTQVDAMIPASVTAITDAEIDEICV